MEEHEPQLEKVDLVITDTPAFQILNEAMKEMKHVVIFQNLECGGICDHQINFL
jgi:hypothetical protein